MKYKVKVYVHHGYFQYEVPTMESAVEHAEAIMSCGVYRRSVGDETVVFFKVHKVKVCGPDLRSEYLDEFKRT